MKRDVMMSLISELTKRSASAFTAEDILTDLCDGAIRVFGVDGAGVMSRRDHRNLFVHATAERIGPLERYQELMQSGPCADAVRDRLPVLVPDMSSSNRWPDYARLARANGISMVLAVPLLSRGRVWGVLDLYSTTARQWSTEELEEAQLLADVAVSYVVMAQDRDQYRAAHVELTYRATHDDLTGLSNRASFLNRLDDRVVESRRDDQQVALVFVDVDLFKALNDSFGHAVGDRVLATVAERLSAATRSGDMVARFAGDEFVLACTAGIDDFLDFGSRVASLTARIHTAIAEPVQLDGMMVSISVSIGVSIAGTGERTPSADDLMIDADGAMYSAKRAGRGRIVVRDHSVDAANDQGYTEQLNKDFPRALERGEFDMHYQPIVDSITHRMVALEALVRWNHPDRGVLSAGTFIDMAIRSGFVLSLGRWVIDEVCRQLRVWQSYGERGPAVVYVNVSAAELADPLLSRVFADALDTHGVPASQLGVEVIEDDLDDLTQRETLSTLRTAGHPLSIDDFGTGFSSLSRLLQLPSDVVKVDRAFAAAASSAPRNVAVVDAIVQLANAMEMHVVAEGVETDEQMRLMTDSGCDLLQGHYFGAPQRPTDLEQFWT